MTSALLLSPHSSMRPLAHVSLIESRRTKTKECLSPSYHTSVSPVSGDLPPSSSELRVHCPGAPVQVQINIVFDIIM